jgi:hypothetical protein
MALRDFLFTSESVSEGHPDKMCDQISDAILDALLAEDPDSRVACESLAKTGMVVVAGEITTRARINYAEIVRNTVRRIGYVSSDMGFDANTCAVLTAIDRQSPDISQGVTAGQGLHAEQGAGDQGLMFGFACDETPELMPLPIVVAHRLVEYLADVRRGGKYPFLRPDSKSQVTVEYREGRPSRVDAVVVSTQHSPDVKYETLRDMIAAPSSTSTRPAASSSADRWETAGSPAARSSSTRTVAMDGTAAAPSPARTPRRSIAAPPTSPATWRRTSSRRGWRRSARCSCRTPSASPIRSPCSSTASAPAPSPISVWPRSSTSTST